MISMSKPSRKVMIATPALDGRVHATYAYCLAETTRLAAENGVRILPLFVTLDALIQNARNDLIAYAVDGNVDDMIWVDSDIAWKPANVLRLLAHPVDVVGGTYLRKQDAEAYVVKADPSHLVADERGLMPVEALGLGFLRMSRRAIKALWDAAAHYRCNGRVRRWVFDVGVVDGELVSEDFCVCRKLNAAGFEIHLDQTITCDHSGHRTWGGDFSAWVQRINQSPNAPGHPISQGVARDGMAQIDSGTVTTNEQINAAFA